MANKQIEAVLRISSKLGPMHALKTLQKELRQVERGATAFNRANSVMAVGANRAVAATARLIAPAALAYGGVRAVKNYAEIERRIGRIGATAEASVADTEEFAQRLRGLASDLRVPFQQIVEGADELAASGKNIDQINALLPAVAMAAHASGAEFRDMATTADAVAGSLGIMESQMLRAFDILVYGGKVGKFELRDMAAELPSLLPAFAALGYKGEEGLNKIVAMLQGVRMETGQSGEAATALMDVFTKMESQTVTNSFKKNFGIDLRKSLAIARREGKDVLDVFLDLAVLAVKGDLSKLPQLFTDKQMLIGMRALINQREQINAWQQDMVNAPGTVVTEWKRFSSDTKAALDALSNSYDRLAASAGKSIVAMGGVTAMDYLSENMDKAAAINKALEKEGYSWLQARWWWARHGFDTAAQDEMARRGGFRTVDAYEAYGDSGDHAAAAARVTPDRERDKYGMPIEGPIPEVRPASSEPEISAPRPYAASAQSAGPSGRERIALPQVPYVPFLAGRSPRDAERESMHALRTDPNGVADAIDEALSTGGERAGRSIEDAARKVNDAGTEAGNAFARRLEGAAQQFGAAAARSFNANIRPVAAGAGTGSVSVNPGVAPIAGP